MRSWAVFAGKCGLRLELTAIRQSVHVSGDVIPGDCTCRTGAPCNDINFLLDDTHVASCSLFTHSLSSTMLSLLKRGLPRSVGTAPEARRSAHVVRAGKHDQELMKTAVRVVT